MSFEQTGTPAPSDESMFGCECAMPFLTLLAVVALGGCDTAADTSPQTAPQDKVGAAFERVDREIARAKARWSRDDAVASRGDDAASAARWLTTGSATADTRGKD